MGLTSERQKGGLPGPPPGTPLPESLAAQGPYVRLSCPGLARARNVSRHWTPPRACYSVPCCETLKRETPVAPRRVQGGLFGSPRIRAGTSKRQRSHALHPPLGQPQLNVPREEPPAWEAPTAQISKEHHHRRAADGSLCGTRPQSKQRLQPGNGEGRRGGVGLGRHISAAGRLYLSLARSHAHTISLSLSRSPRLHRRGAAARRT